MVGYAMASYALLCYIKSIQGRLKTQLELLNVVPFVHAIQPKQLICIRRCSASQVWLNMQKCLLPCGADPLCPLFGEAYIGFAVCLTTNTVNLIITDIIKPSVVIVIMLRRESVQWHQQLANVMHTRTEILSVPAALVLHCRDVALLLQQDWNGQNRQEAV